MRATSACVLLALATACSGGSAESTPPSSATPTTPATTTPSPPPSPPPVAVRLLAPACGYGGSAPAVTVFVDVETEVPLHGIAFSFAVADATTHAVGGHSREPTQTVVSPLERGLLDFSTQGTTPFDGELAAGARTRLQYWAGVDDLQPSVGGPIEVQLSMRTSDGQSFEVTCTSAEMLPSS